MQEQFIIIAKLYLIITEGGKEKEGEQMKRQYKE